MNNVSLRKVILGGTAAKRTVTVPPYQLIKRRSVYFRLSRRARRVVVAGGAIGSMRR